MQIQHHFQIKFNVNSFGITIFCNHTAFNYIQNLATTKQIMHKFIKGRIFSTKKIQYKKKKKITPLIHLSLLAFTIRLQIQEK